MENLIAHYYNNNFNSLKPDTVKESYPYFLDEGEEEHLLFI